MSERQIDALLAEHLFGYRIEWNERECKGTRSMEPLRTMLTVGGPTIYKFTPKYSTTWEGMGQVVEAMRAKGWAFDIHAGAGGQTKATFSADERPGIAFEFEWADTAPMAVALAALKAFGVEVPA